MIPLSLETIRRIQATFAPSEHQHVADRLLRECGDNLPLVNTNYGQLAERIRFAVVKLSRGDLAELDNWIRIAHADWRDVLVAAGFAHSVEEHLKWQPE